MEKCLMGRMPTCVSNSIHNRNFEDSVQRDTGDSLNLPDSLTSIKWISLRYVSANYTIDKAQTWLRLTPNSPRLLQNDKRSVSDLPTWFLHKADAAKPLLAVYSRLEVIHQS